MFKTMDVLTLVALVAGPAMAVCIQLFFEQRRETRRSKIAILDVLMGYRGRLTSPECVSALNRVELVFYRDSAVIAKHKALLDHMEIERNYQEAERQGGWARRADLVAELISTISESLGYRFSHTGIKTTAYVPKAMIDESEYIVEIRRQLLGMTSGKMPLTVHVITSVDEEHSMS